MLWGSEFIDNEAGSQEFHLLDVSRILFEEVSILDSPDLRALDVPLGPGAADAADAAVAALRPEVDAPSDAVHGSEPGTASP